MRNKFQKSTLWGSLNRQKNSSGSIINLNSLLSALISSSYPISHLLNTNRRICLCLSLLIPLSPSFSFGNGPISQSIFSSETRISKYYLAVIENKASFPVPSVWKEVIKTSLRSENRAGGEFNCHPLVWPLLCLHGGELNEVCMCTQTSFSLLFPTHDHLCWLLHWVKLVMWTQQLLPNLTVGLMSTVFKICMK